MDSGIYDGRITANRATPLDPFLLSEMDQDPMDRFPRFGPDPFHVRLQRLMARLFFEPESHEGAERIRVLQVEFQLAVAQAVNLLEQRGPQNLIAAQSPTPSIAPPSLQEIFLDEFRDLWMRIENSRRHLQFSGMLVRAPDGNER